MPTTIAGKYEVLERIGGGGQGTVFRVRHLFLEEIRALKVQADPGDGASDSVMRVLREGRALARLRHPNIVQVFDLGRDGNQHYLEMEYVDGPNLAQWLRASGRPALRDALAIGRQIAGALAYAHAQQYVDSSGAPRTGLIHRDVKPSNILLRRGTNAHALLADFGLVKIGDGTDRTQLGTMMGTYRYSAPEQLGFKRDGKRAPVDQRADLFSLGLVLYELVEGSPFHGALGSEEVIARLLLDRDPLEPTFSCPVDPELAELVAAMVHRHPDERLAGGMAEVVRILDRVIARLSPDPPMLDDLTQPLGKVMADLERKRSGGDTFVASAPSPPPVAAAPPVIAPAPREPAPAPRAPVLAPRETAPPPRKAPPPPAAPARAAWWTWAVAAGVLVALAVGTWRFLAPPAQAPPPPLRIASVDPSGDAALEVPVGKEARFAISIAESDRQPELGVVWHVDGHEAGHGTTFAFRPATGDDGGTKRVEVVASAKGGRVSHTWTVTVPAVPTTLPQIAAEEPPTPRAEVPVVAVEAPAPTVPPVTTPPATTPPPRLAEEAPPRIETRLPPSDRVGVMLGQSQDFSVRLAPSESRRYAYAWFLDGRPVGSDPVWRYRATQMPAPGAAPRVEVEVTDDRGRAAERVLWRVDVRAPPPKIVEIRPSGKELKIAAGEAPELTVKATPGRPDARLRYEWRIDRLPTRITKQGNLTVPDDLSAGKHTIEVVAIDDEEDRRSAAQRWTLVIGAPASARPVVSEPPSSGARVNEAEARQWVDRLRTAWERRDGNALRDLGELPSSRVPRGKVVIGEASIIIDSAGANVWWDRVEDGATSRIRARLVRDAGGRVVRR